MLSKQLNLIKRAYIEVKNVAEFQAATKGKSGYVLQFTASWCGPCKQLSPLLYKKQSQGAGKWSVIKIDVDQEGNSELCEKIGLEAIPTMIWMKDGKQVSKVVGGKSSSQLDELINLIK